jgi:hypothetical protein
MLSLDDLKVIAIQESRLAESELWGDKLHRSRKDRFVRVRAACVFVAVQNDFKLADIAEGLGFDDHTSIMHLRDIAPKWAGTNVHYGRFILKLNRIWTTIQGAD